MPEGDGDRSPEWPVHVLGQGGMIEPPSTVATTVGFDGS
jgi:hypothetical protein